MIFVKRNIPLIICFLTGVFCALIYYVPAKFGEDTILELSEWYIIIGGLAFFLGFFTLLITHINKIEKQQPGWGYSLFVFLGVIIMFAAGLYTRITIGSLLREAGGKLTPHGWVYDHLFNALQATMFSLLAFFIASAAFRAFRVRNIESFVLLICALILIFSRTSLGQYVWGEFCHIILTAVNFYFGSGFEKTPFVAGFVEFSEWIMDVLNMAARRGVLFGVALGALAMSLKVIFGVERAYLGRD